MNAERFGRRLGVFVTRNRLLTIVLSLLTFVGVAFGMTKATFSSDYRIFFGEEDPRRQAFDELETVFTKTDNIVFVVKPKDGSVFSPEPIAAIQDLTDGGWKLPHATRVDSLANYQYAYSEDEDIVVESLVFAPAAELLPEDFPELEKRASGDPLLEGGLLAQDHEAAGVNVTLRLPGEDPSEVIESADAARKLADAIQAEHPSVEIRLSGMALMNEAFMEASIQDMSKIVPVMYVVMIVVLGLMLRSALATGAIVVIVALCSGITIGLAGWLGYPLTPPTASAPTVVLTLAVADGVHLFSSMQASRRAGVSKNEAIIEALRANLRPIILTSLTTAIGFLCLNFAEAPPYWHLGNMTAAGIAAALIYSVTLLPALLSLLPIGVSPARRGYQAGFDGLSRWVTKHRHKLVMGAAVTTLVLGFSATKLESNDQFVDYFDDSIQFRPDTLYMMDNLAGIYTVEYRVEAGGEEAIHEPEYLATLDGFSQWLRAQPEVTYVYSYADVIKRINKTMHDDDPAFDKVPDNREAAAQELMLWEMSLPMGLDLNDRVDIARASTRVSVTLTDISSAQLRDFITRSEGWLADNAPEAMHARATSPVVIFTQLSHENTKSMMVGNFVSLALISVCLVLALGSLRLGLVSVIPNLMPIVFGYGLWALLFAEINIVASIAGTVCLGIIVDDTIHVLSKYQLARRDGLDASEALRRTLGTVGPALVATTAVLAFGFGVLTQSGFEMNSVLGLLVVMVVVFALLADLLVLPALLVLFGRGR